MWVLNLESKRPAYARHTQIQTRARLLTKDKLVTEQELMPVALRGKRLPGKCLRSVVCGCLANTVGILKIEMMRIVVQKLATGIMLGG